ncbi:MAG: membrane or secreted protein [Bacteroidota bacterium]|nr:membrane or secreted protein [Bacteroidota bacterium]
MQLIIIAIVLLALAFAGIAIKILVKKDGKFSGTCSSNNPMLQKEGASCGICGARPEEQCKSPNQPNSSSNSITPGER